MRGICKPGSPLIDPDLCNKYIITLNLFIFIFVSDYNIIVWVNVMTKNLLVHNQLKYWVANNRESSFRWPSLFPALNFLLLSYYEYLHVEGLADVWIRVGEDMRRVLKVNLLHLYEILGQAIVSKRETRTFLSSFSAKNREETKREKKRPNHNWLLFVKVCNMQLEWGEIGDGLIHCRLVSLELYGYLILWYDWIEFARAFNLGLPASFI